MTFEELIAQLQETKGEQRSLEPNYMEIVVNNTQLVSANIALQSYFGPPLKPAGREATSEASGYAKPYGGIYENQTLYFRQNGPVAEVALLWPWGSGASTTIKIVRQKKS